MLTFSTDINVNNNLSNTETPLSEPVGEQDSLPNLLDFDKWSKRNPPATDDHQHAAQYQPRHNTGVAWSAQYAAMPPSSGRLPPWLVDRNDGASLLGRQHGGGRERARSYVDEAQGDVYDGVAADRYYAQQAEQVEVPDQQLSLVGRNGDSEQNLKLTDYLPSGPDQRTSHNIDQKLNPDAVEMKPSAMEVEREYVDNGVESADGIGRKRVVDLKPSVSDAFASDYQESLLVLSRNREKNNMEDKSNARETVAPEVIQSTASRLRSLRRGHKRLMLESLRDSPNSRKLHRKRVLIDKNPPESRISSLVIPDSLPTLKQTSVTTRQNGSSTSTTRSSGGSDSVDSKPTIVGFVGSANQNESGVTFQRRNASRSALYQLKQLYRDDLQNRHTNRDTDKSPTSLVTVQSQTSSNLNLSAPEVSSPTGRVSFLPLDTAEDIVARQSAVRSADSPVPIPSRNSERLGVKDSRQYSAKGKHFDRSPMRDQKRTVNRLALWKRGRKFAHRHRERRQAASASSTPSASSSSGSSSASASASSSGVSGPPAQQSADADKQRLMQLVAASMSDAEQAARHLTPNELNALLAGSSGALNYYFDFNVSLQ